VAAVVWTPERVRVPGDGMFNPDLREPRIGVMVHYDGSSSDHGGLAWFADPKCEVSYQVGALDDGRWAQIAPDSARAWHAGACRTSDPKRLSYRDANSAFYAIAALTDETHQVTVAQMLTIAWKIRTWFRAEGWKPEETWRIVGHDTEAVFERGHARAGQRGRKIDPTGPNPKNPILAIEDIRYLVPRLTL
jgi:N-acetyl-anhydromuramyl-L-alanine amidase AmpD